MKKEIIEWIRSLGVKRAVIGISGGKDSAVAAALCVEALGKENVFGILMPNGTQSDIADSHEVVNFLGIPSFTINIGNMFEELVHQGEFLSEMPAFDMSVTNIAPRLRMTTLRFFSQVLGARVCGTGNACEAYVGYCTKDGDTSCDFNPLANLTVAEVIAVGRELGLPEHLICKTPHDGLGTMSDEEKLGVTYDDIAKVIKNEEVDELVKERIIAMHNYSRHKFKPAPAFKPKK